MEWESITLEFLLDKFKKGHPEVEFKTVDEYIIGNINKIVEVSFHINETDHDIWKSHVLVHCGVNQKKGVLQGYGTAVDNFADLDKEVAYCISKGKEWAGFKELKKKLF